MLRFVIAAIALIAILVFTVLLFRPSPIDPEQQISFVLILDYGETNGRCADSLRKDLERHGIGTMWMSMLSAQMGYTRRGDAEEGLRLAKAAADRCHLPIIDARDKEAILHGRWYEGGAHNPFDRPAPTPELNH